MIVVAIIGILAAVAIPGFMGYIKSSKTSEAKENLKAIAEGALSYYETEHPSSDGMSATTKLYPKAGAATTTNIPNTAQGVGVKADPGASAAVITASPWSDMNFKISKPFYYQYSYVNGDKQSLFGAQANASLSYANDSTFQVKGDNCGVVSSIIDASSEKGDTKAPTVTAATERADCTANKT